MTLAALKAEAARLHVALDDRKDSGRGVAQRNGTMPIEHELVLTAPDRMRFDEGVHERVLRYGRGRDERARVIAAAALDLQTLEPCTDPDCEWCAEVDLG